MMETISRLDMLIHGILGGSLKNKNSREKQQNEKS
jgi:hypothetical protein